MAKQKSSKKALLSSALSLVLCLAMLIGTTFAWFTDSVTSANNKIVAGSLDIDVYYGDPADKKSVTDVQTLFNDVALWEPGAVAWENLTVINLGTLALKYRMAVNFSNENTVNGYGLSQVLKVGFVEGGIQNAASGREAVLNEVTKWTPMSNFNVFGEMEKQNETDTYGMVIYWEPSAEDNNWNVNNEKKTSDGEPLHIDLGIELVAAQYTSESDSFNNQYDAGARYAKEVGTVDEFIKALNNNDDVILANDIDLAGITWNSVATYSGVLDGNGKAVKNLTGENGLFEVINGATIKNLTLENVAITATSNHTGAIAGSTKKDATAATNVIENVTVSGAVTGGEYYTGGLIGADSSFSSVIRNCVNNAAVTGQTQVGGITGYAKRDTLIENCVNNGTISGTYIVGGLIGLAAGDDDNLDRIVKIVDSTNNGTVTVNASSTPAVDLVGGIAGAVGRDGGDDVVNEIKVYILNCTVLSGQKTYGAKYNYGTGKGEKITVVDGKEIAEGVYESGTRNYYVADAQGLINVASIIPQNREQSQSINLMNDIDLSGITWEPLNNMHLTFNGNGYTISNVTCKEGWRSGFFGYAGGVTINDLTLENVTASGSQVGAFAGSGEGFKLNNCYLKGDNTISYYATTETWGGIGAITGVITGTTANVEIVAGTTVTINKNSIVTECKYFDDLTGYLNANNGAVVNNGTIVVNK